MERPEGAHPAGKGAQETRTRGRGRGGAAAEGERGEGTAERHDVGGDQGADIAARSEADPAEGREAPAVLAAEEGAQ